MNILKKKKKELRIQLKSRQLSLNNETLEKKSQEITRKIQSRKEYQDAHKIAIFMSFNKEFQTSYLLEDASKKFYIPRIENDNMDFYLYTREFRTSLYGIKEPVSNEKINKEEIDLMIIPYLGYNKEGYRIGYGKGYYDRYIKNTTFTIILPGIREYCIDFDPEEFDIPVHYIIEND